MSNCSKFSSGNELLPLDLYMTETHCYKPEVEGLSKQGMQVATNYFFRMTLLLWVLIYISNASSQSFIFWLLQCVGQKKNRNIKIKKKKKKKEEEEEEKEEERRRRGGR